jgi:hypothetical protein
MRRPLKDSAVGFILHEIVRRPIALIVVGLIAGVLIGIFVVH